MQRNNKLLLCEIALFGVLGSITFALKLALSGLPNIEPVSLLTMVYAVVFGKKCFYSVYVYVALEILVFGIGIWNIYYLYIWAILAFAAMALRKIENPVLWAVISGAYGLLFGALCMPVDIVIGGLGYAAARWVSGIPFDLLHCAGNFTFALVLFVPLRKLLEMLYSKMKAIH